MTNNSDQELRNTPFVILSAIEFTELETKSQVDLPKRHEKHFSKVLRKSTFTAYVSNGEGQIKSVVIEQGTIRENGETKKVVREKTLKLNQSIIRPKGLEVVVQKATELGVSEIQLFSSEHSFHKLPKLPRLLQISENAAMQSKNAFLSKISITDLQLEKLIEAESDSLVFWGDINSSERLGQVSENSKTIVFFNGPEGGWSSAEEQLLKNCFRGISLSHNVLRAETAAIAFISQLS